MLYVNSKWENINRGAALVFKADPDTDPDPAFYLNADTFPGSQTNADPCGSRFGSDIKVTKVEF
jgi:hypothetical protein